MTTIGYCEQEDVRRALQEQSLDTLRQGPLGSGTVKSTITGVSTWFHRASQNHFYDSGSDSDLLSTEAASATVTLSVPSSPHAQVSQIHRTNDSGHVRYPQQSVGPYAKLPLDHHHVETVTTLEVRDYDGSVEDWVASSEYAEGRGEDYYTQVEDTSRYGRSYLYIDANSIGPRETYDDLLRVAYDYGLDAADDDWQDVRRGVGLLSASQLVTDDDVLTAIPDDGQLVNLETQRDELLNDAVRSAVGLLRPYL